MKKEKIIDEKLFDAEEKLGKVETKKRINNLVGTLCALGCGVAAIASFGTSLGFGLAWLSSSALIGLLASRDNGFKKQEIAKLTQEVDHMEKLSDEGLARSGELTRKRMFKVKELQRELDCVEDCYKSSETKSNIFAVLSGIGIGLTAAVNPLFVIAPAVGLILTGSYALEAKDANAQREYLNNRIENLETDIEISKEINASEIATAKKVKTPTMKRALGETKDKKIDPAVEGAIDSYVESLAAQTDSVDETISIKR